MFEVRPPALAGPQVDLGPSAPLSLGLKSILLSSYLGPGSPLKPGPKSIWGPAPRSRRAPNLFEARRPALAGPRKGDALRRSLVHTVWRSFPEIFAECRRSAVGARLRPRYQGKRGRDHLCAGAGLLGAVGRYLGQCGWQMRRPKAR